MTSSAKHPANPHLKIFVREGALKTGHFQLSSGLHSGQYIQCALVLRNPATAGVLGKALAAKFKGVKADGVISPAVGGILAGHELARALGTEHFFAERQEGKMVFRRGFAVKRGARYIVAEDVITTGGSTREVMDAVKAGGGKVVGVASLVCRSAGVSFRVPFHYLLALSIPSYAPERCPLCREGVPLASPGSKRLK